MLFSELLTRAGSACSPGRGDAEVTDVQIDSRRCGEGSCFVALRGRENDGHRYIPLAIDAGARAVVCEDPSTADNARACAVVDDTHEAAGPLAQAIRGWPARKLTCVGVTGTNGKTTVVHMVRSVLAAEGSHVALLGTISYETGSGTYNATTTTPDPVALSELTAEMVAAGKTHLVMEVSSHALDQRRTAGVDFAVGVYTNLSGDHLDYHGDMDAYFAAKLRLFEGLGPHASAILNRDDRFADRLAEITSGRVSWYGLSPAADIRARIEEITVDGSRFVLICDGREIPVGTGMIGRHNVQNCLAAAGASRVLGVEAGAIAEALGTVRCVPGRLERVNGEAPYSVFVDYAHTDDALRNVLSSLRPVVKGRIITVFGCGGDRDRTKRPRMGRVAEQLSDRIVITSDNPRSEDPQAIIEQIVSGLSPPGLSRTDIEPDRRAAIALAVAQAQPADLVLIAGKGHETYQIVAGNRLEFDDVEVAGQIVASREGRS